MKALYFDCFSGISGDMTLGALIDLGINKEKFINELKKLNLSGYEIVIEKKEVNGIFGTDVQVILSDELKELEEKIKKHEQEHHHDHTHSHEHDGHIHSQQHGHSHSHGDGHSHFYGQDGHSHSHSHEHSMRNLKAIEMIIDWSDLKQSVKDFSKKVFREIARAEAAVHNKDINEIHFHEVGAVDSIIDIVGTAICIDMLGVEKVFSSPLHDGRGFIECRHGIIPVPVPAVMEMLKGTGIPLITEDVNTEMVTPTGMGLIKSMASGFGNMPAMIIDRIGYGMGKRDTGRFNALRAILGSLPDEDRMLEEIAVLETNIDDMSPEILAFVSEQLLERGALDVYYMPIYMKKGRPAVLLTVLSSLDKEQELVDLILKETSTLGIRRSSVERYCMERNMIKLATRHGEVGIKVASKEGFSKFAPEYEDCRKIARKTGIPLQKVYDMVREEYWRSASI
ncbi:MAG: nickel pincer cofactor biosynthesis protein LarC [Acetivibrionales bacterium]|jgi:uncharacterized protein (TIGR00299 family) protein